MPDPPESPGRLGLDGLVKDAGILHERAALVIDESGTVRALPKDRDAFPDGLSLGSCYGHVVSWFRWDEGDWLFMGGVEGPVGFAPDSPAYVRSRLHRAGYENRTITRRSFPGNPTLGVLTSAVGIVTMALLLGGLLFWLVAVVIDGDRQWLDGYALDWSLYIGFSFAAYAFLRLSRRWLIKAWKRRLADPVLGAGQHQ